MRKKTKEELDMQAVQVDIKFNPEDLTLSVDELKDKYGKMVNAENITQYQVYVAKLKELRESIKIYNGPHPLKELLPSLDQTQLHTQKEIVAINTNPNDQHTLEIGRFQSDTDFLEQGLSLLILYETEILTKLHEIFNNEIIIEIGSGKSSIGYLIAKLVGAKSYIAVDPFGSHLTSVV